MAKITHWHSRICFEINFKMDENDVYQPLVEAKCDKANQLEINAQNAEITGYTMCTLCCYGKPPDDREGDSCCKVFFRVWRGRVVRGEAESR